MRPPCEACDLVNGGGISGSRSSSYELFSEHDFSVRDQVPPKGAHDFRQSFASPPIGGLHQMQFSGSIVIVQIYDIPRPCRDTGPPHKAGFVFFLGFPQSPSGAIRAVRNVGLFANLVNGLQ
jgi:hypothetical protein